MYQVSFGCVLGLFWLCIRSLLYNMYVCVCMSIHVYTCVYKCVCVCVCMTAVADGRERARNVEGETKIKRAGERQMTPLLPMY